MQRDVPVYSILFPLDYLEHLFLLLPSKVGSFLPRPPPEATDFIF